jgi:hypothetical protein
MQRYGSKLERHALSVEPFTNRPFLEALHEAKAHSVSDLIIGALSKAPCGLGVEEINEITGTRAATVKKSLCDLCAKGAVIRTGKGKKGGRFIYSLPTDALPPLKGDNGNNNDRESLPKKSSIGREE